MLDAITEFLGIGHIFAGNVTDTFGVGGVKLQWNTKRDRGQNGQLVGRIDAFHIKGGIRFGITQLLGLL